VASEQKGAVALVNRITHGGGRDQAVQKSEGGGKGTRSYLFKNCCFNIRFLGGGNKKVLGEPSSINTETTTWHREGKGGLNIGGFE